MLKAHSIGPSEGGGGCAGGDCTSVLEVKTLLLLLLLACYRGWWCKKIPPTPCLENWPKMFKKEKKGLSPPPPPPPPISFVRTCATFEAVWPRTRKKSTAYGPGAKSAPPFSKSSLRAWYHCHENQNTSKLEFIHDGSRRFDHCLLKSAY